MTQPYTTLKEDVNQKFGISAQEFRGEANLVVPAEQLVDVVECIKTTHGFVMLADITAVDYFPETTPRFHVVSLYVNTENHSLICVRVPVYGTTKSIPSLSGIFPNATWYEREIWDMFGIRFDGNPDLRRIIMPFDWEGHPLRKDYPLGYEEVQYSFNYKEIDLKKPYAIE